MSNILPPDAVRVQRGSLVVGVVALAICLLGAFVWPDQFFRAYLAAYQVYLGIGLGSLVLLCIYHLTGGAWGFLIQRLLEAAMRTLPLLAVLFVPLACGLGYLYVWARPEEVAAHKDLQHKALYLNPPFVWGRIAVFFLLWNGFAFLLNFWSQRQDSTGDASWSRRLNRVSGPALVVYGLTVTFTSVDWLMSLQTGFHSTMFGPLIASGHILSGLCCALLALSWLAPRQPLAGVVSAEGLNDLGNLLFTFLVIWAYMIWFQYMIIWIGNLPYEVIWYLPRLRDGWQWVAYALVLFFVTAFFLLLMKDVKRDLSTLSKIAGLILFMQVMHNYYLVMPAFPNTSIVDHWMDFLLPLGIGGVWLAYYLHELAHYPLVARASVNESAALHLRHMDEAAAARMRELQHGG